MIVIPTSLLTDLSGVGVAGHIGTGGEDGSRRLLLRHFPYAVYFDIDGATVYVLAVAHQRRAPGYWRNR